MNPILPADPAMLYSYVNMKLRDEYSSLEEMCEDLDISEQELRRTLSAAGFEYVPERNRFV